MSSDQDIEIIKRFVHAINEAWVNGDPNLLQNFFDEDIVMDMPGAPILRGQKACIDSYRTFLKQAKVGDFSMGDIEINIWDQTAIARYTFEVSYEYNGDAFREKGIDVFAFIKTRNPVAGYLENDAATATSLSRYQSGIEDQDVLHVKLFNFCSMFHYKLKPGRRIFAH